MKPAKPFTGRDDPRRHKGGRALGVKNKPKLGIFEDGLIQAVGMPLKAVLNPDNREIIDEKMDAAVKQNPVGFFVRVIIPLARLLPQQVMVEIFGAIATTEEAKDYLGNLLAARDEVIAARKEAMRDNGGKRSPRRSRA